MPGRALKPATLRSALAIAWPASAAAIVTPLLGLIDTAVLARGAEAEALAGASLGAAVVSMLYWTFGFLRMSLSGLSAQAHGAGDTERLRIHLLQGAGLGLTLGLIILALLVPISEIAHRFLVESSAASEEAGAALKTYLGIRLLAAPAAITTTAFLGWFTGQGRTGLLMLVGTGTAVTNAILSIWFVLGMDRGIEGLATATAIAELLGLGLALGAAAYVLAQKGALQTGWRFQKAGDGMLALLSLNGDLFVRTLILDLVFLSFARFGAGFGDLTVAANHVLLNLVLAVTLLLDGPAIAAEAFVGQALGAPDKRAALFRAAWLKTAQIAGLMAVGLFVLLAVFGQPILMLTVGDGPDTERLLDRAFTFWPWAVVMPLAVAAAYHLDGVYVGASRGQAMRNTMLVAGALYFALAFLLAPVMGNHGLWLAMLLFMGMRGIGLVVVWPPFRQLIERGVGPAHG